MASSGPPPPNSRDDFEIAIVCALAVEYDAVSLLIDRFWDEDGDKYGRAIRDRNTYTTGRMGSFDIVLMLLPNAGKVSAASAASSFRSSFPNITLALLVGTCGGVPYTKDNEEILLGDVVISKTVIQYDLGSQYTGQFQTKETLEERLGRPDSNIRGIVHIMETDHERERLNNRAAVLLEHLQSHARRKKLRKPAEHKYEYPGTSKDRLFEADYLHKHQVLLPYRCCEEAPCDSSHASSCADLGCEDDHLVQRQRLTDQAQNLSIFIGRFGSGDTMLKSGTYRDQVAQRHGLLAFEMEGAGVWDELPCIIIKGISNYADGHWNADSDWQHFAAATAAATARALIERYPKTDRSHPPLAIKEHRRTQEEEECLRDMRITDPALDKKRIEDTNGGLLKDSYIWILSNAEFIQWRDDPDGGLLWIKGDPGKGKTMLLCGLINELQADGATRPYYFFCQASDSRLNSATKVLCSLIYSFACEDEQALSYVMEKYKHAGKELFYDINAWSALSGIMMNILRHIKLKDKVFIIDGLDECVADLPLLLDFIAQAPGLSEAKWVVSSRNWPNIEERLTTSTRRLPLSLELNEQSISDAVYVYITHKLGQLVALKKLDETSRGAVESHLTAHANGTFLWVALVYKELFKEGVKKRHLQDLMTAFPPELGPLYNRMMAQVCESRDKGICIQVLELISLTYRPISLVELASLVEILEDNDDFDEMRDIIATCGSFLVLKDDVIYFIHQSAKDFLLNNTPSEIFTSGIAFKHHDIFSRSVQILSQTLRRDMYNLRHPGARPSVPNPDPLATLQYACIYWVDHLQDSSGEATAQASLQDDGLVHSFVKVFLLHWLEAFCLMGKLSEGIMAIRMLESLTAQDSGQLHKFIRDARRFALSFRPAIEYTPLQLYSSALLFTPTSSIVRQTFESVHTAHWITQKPSVRSEWNAFVQELKGHKDGVCSLVFSPDNTKLASYSEDGNLRLWDRATGACLQSLNLDATVYKMSMAYSPDSSQLALAFNKSIRVLDINTSAFTMTHNVGFFSSSVMFSLDGLQLITSDELWDSNWYRIWDLKTGVQLRATDYYRDVGEPAVSQLATTGICYKATIRSPRTGSRVRVFIEDYLKRVVFTLDGTKLALLPDLGSSPIYILNVATGKRLQVFTTVRKSVKDMVFSPKGTRLATAYVGGDIQIWDVETGVCLFTFPTHGNLFTIAYSPDDTELASSGNQTIKIWDLTLDVSVKTEEKPSIWSATYSPDSTRLAFITNATKATNSFIIEIWDVVTGIRQQQLRVENAVSSWLGDSHFDIARDSDITHLAFSADQTQLAYWTTSEIAIWDFAANTVRNVGRIKRWIGNTIRSKHSIGFSPCGIRLALVFNLFTKRAETSEIEIRDVTNGAIVHTFYSKEPILETNFSLHGRRLGSVSNNGKAAIWDLHTGACLQTLRFNFEKMFKTPLIIRTGKVEHFQLERLQRAQAQFFIANILKNRDSLHSHIHEFDLGSNNSWLLRRGEPFLWLPPEYRPTDMTFAGDSVGIILSHREILLFRFNLAQLDAEMASNRSSVLKI